MCGVDNESLTLVSESFDKKKVEVARCLVKQQSQTKVNQTFGQLAVTTGTFYTTDKLSAANYEL